MLEDDQLGPVLRLYSDLQGGSLGADVLNRPPQLSEALAAVEAGRSHLREERRKEAEREAERKARL